MKVMVFLSFVLLFQSCVTISIKSANELDSIVAEIDGQLSEKTDKNIPGVVIALIENGEVYYQKAFGFKNRKTQEVMSVDTVFQVASISKSVFALAIMKLMEEGQIDIDSPIESYLTQWKLPESKYNSNEVTARKILTHSAGLSVHGYPGYNPKKELPSIEQSLSNRFRVKLKNEPGKIWKYSGGGYTILQLALENITGQSLSEYMKDTILKEMGMTKSSYDYNYIMNNDLAKPYNRLGVEIPNYLYTEKAAAGLYTTVIDLAQMIIEIMRCYNNIDNNSVISRETLELIINSQMEIDKETSMGMGFFIFNIGNGVKTYGHSGGNRGWRAHYEFSLEKNSGIVVLTNSDSGKKVISPILSTWRNYVCEK